MRRIEYNTGYARKKSYLLRRVFLSVIIIILLGAIIGRFFINANDRHLRSEIDSLNSLAYKNRYRNLDSTLQQAQQALRLAESYPEGQAKALNNLGFHAFMKMDFDKAMHTFLQVYDVTRNEIELLIADVGLMKICQRTSQNKEFYDHRTNAMRKIRRIEEERQALDSVNLARFIYAETEFHIVSSIYYFYLQQEEQSLEEINAINPNEDIQGDTAQWLYYLYMKGSGGLCEGINEIEIAIREFDYLNQCLRISREGGYTYFEANSLQAFAELLIDPVISKIIYDNRPIAIYSIEKEYGLKPYSFLPIQMADKALDLFKEYNDLYQIAGTLRTIASCLIRQQEYATALDTLNKALNYVNIHHRMYYECDDSTHRLYSYVPDENVSLEMLWMNTPDVKTVPEWILRIREQLSLVYAGLNKKVESDYNRNIYLDLLEYTRQDKELESRYDALDRELTSLNGIIFATIIGMIFLILLLTLLNNHWKKKHAQQVNLLRRTLDICRRIIVSIPLETDDNQEMVQAVIDEIEPDFKELFNATSLCIYLEEPKREDEEKGDTKQPLHKVHFPLIVPHKSRPIGFIELTTLHKLNKEERAIIRVIAPYFAWAIENGNDLILLGDEHKRIEKERYIHQLHLAENKRQNIVKKACLSLVTGITPFIDRVIHEVNKLNQSDKNEQNKYRVEQYQYLNELIDKIIDYNDILALWIKVKQGSLKLNIESFALADLFNILAKSRQSFELKKQTFTLEPTTSYVKADKALTLFMINTLTENARKYTPDGGTVCVSSVETDKYVEISVTDNGPGISETDVHRILNEKFYDSGTIGQESEQFDELKKKKGSGFGLMNCKGIIEKYRKTNELFNVCVFSIESQTGKGSRFYFRLPKGIKRNLLLLITLFVNLHSFAQKDSLSTDTLLAAASHFADEAYYSNVHKEFEQALIHIDSAIFCLNSHYKTHSGGDTLNLLTLTGKGKASEIDWLQKEYDTDYYIILDIRNEAAVSFLALRQWDNYRYNNSAYTRLYKLVSEDKSLEAYCRQMIRSSSNRTVGITICALLILICGIAYYVLYLRRKLMYRLHLEQVFDINRSVFAASVIDEHENDEVTSKINQQGLVEVYRQIPYKILKQIWNGINELFPIRIMAIGICNEEANNTDFSFYPKPVETQRKYLTEKLEECINKYKDDVSEDGIIDSLADAITDDECFCLPLLVDVGKKHHCIGAIAICRQAIYDPESELLLTELIAGFISIVILNKVTKPTTQYSHIETVQDEARRALHEDTLLHVQNLVLDNCLSTIKHETIYYPSRIKQILQQLSAIADKQQEQEFIADMTELISYYKDIFTLLSSCAARQLEEVTFRRTSFNARPLVEEYFISYFNKALRRNGYVTEAEDCPTLKVECSDITLMGDYNELCFLLESLMDEALACRISGLLLLTVKVDGKFACFEFTDTRRTFSQEELNLLFSPEHLKKASNTTFSSKDVLEGTEFLICKQIIREHDEYMGHPGCRINAEKVAEGTGFKVWFTIPLQKKNNYK